MVQLEKMAVKSFILEQIGKNTNLMKAICSQKPDFLRDTKPIPTIGEIKNKQVFDYLYPGEPQDEQGVLLCIQVNGSASGSTYNGNMIKIEVLINRNLMITKGVTVDFANNKYSANRADYILAEIGSILSNKAVTGAVNKLEYVSDGETIPISNKADYTRHYYYVQFASVNRNAVGVKFEN